MRSAIMSAVVTLAMTGCAVPASEALPQEEELGNVTQALGESGTVRGLGGKCLDVQWGSTAPGTPLHMWPCHSGPAQQWNYTANREIRGLGGLCLDVQWGSTAPGTPLHMWPCNGGAAQKFDVLGNGTIRGLGGLCVDVRGANYAAGAAVQMWPCNDGVAQRWSFSIPQTYRGSQLHPNWVLYTGDYVSNGSRNFVMQADCNLVLYEGSTALWASNTMGRGRSCYALMQTDGNLVVYNENQTAVWASGTNGNWNSSLVVQSDGNVVIYNSASRATWATNTVKAPPSSPSVGLDPACTFSRTDSKCVVVTMWCKNVYSCGWDYGSLTPIEKDDGWYFCGVCTPKIGW